MVSHLWRLPGGQELGCDCGSLRQVTAFVKPTLLLTLVVGMHLREHGLNECQPKGALQAAICLAKTQALVNLYNSVLINSMSIYGVD